MGGQTFLSIVVEHFCPCLDDYIRSGHTHLRVCQIRWAPNRGNIGWVATAATHFLTFLAGFWPRYWSQRLGNGRGIHGGRFSGPGDHSGPISGHVLRSRARPIFCDLNIVTLPQLRLLRHQHCVLREDRYLFLQQERCLSGEIRDVCC